MQVYRFFTIKTFWAIFVWNSHGHYWPLTDKVGLKKGDCTWDPLDPHLSPGPGSFLSVLYCSYRHTEYAYTVLLWSLLYGAKFLFFISTISWKFNLTVFSYKDDDILILCIILSVPFIKILWSLLFQNLPYFLVLERQRLLVIKHSFSSSTFPKSSLFPCTWMAAPPSGKNKKIFVLF